MVQLSGNIQNQMFFYRYNFSTKKDSLSDQFPNMVIQIPYNAQKPQKTHVGMQLPG